MCRREGSFYTPESVTKFLVEDSVDLAIALNPQRKPWELVCLDPACGSGHFLVELVNYIRGYAKKSTIVGPTHNGNATLPSTAFSALTRTR